MDAEMTTSGGFNLLIDLANGPEELQDGIVAIANNAPHGNISLASNDDLQDVELHWHLRFIKDTTLAEGECAVMIDATFEHEGKQDSKRTAIVVKYHRKIEAFRSLGRILGASRQIQSSNNGGAPADLQTLLNFTEKARYENLAVMIDCSRGGVPKQSSVFYLLRNCALMGINMLQLYTEDTYQLEGETFFGYLRGPYTQQELKNIDDYAFALGIELVPCIQTLGHLGQILQWPRFHIFRDTNEVLLPNWDETYNLIEKMIRTVSAPLRSKKIHIGLDEAGGVGEGRFRQIFGYEEPSRVFLQHVKRVQDICKRLDLKPMLWSDTNKNNSLAGYYDGGTPQLADTLPPDIDLVYWDYYHTTSISYATKLQQHRELGCANPWLATACQAAKRKDDGISNMMLTIWGDEGHECDMFSSLPALHYYADHAYTLEDEVDLERIRYCFEGVIGGNYDDWVFASKIDQVSEEDTPLTLKTHFAPNTSKYLMWEDPFLSHISPQYGHLNLEIHYANISNYLARALEFNETYPQNARLRMAYLVSNVLGLKCHLHQRMVMAYQLGNRQDLYDLTEGRLVDLQVALDQLWKYHRLMWHKNNKPFGWEVVELRYGGLRTRLMTMRDRILEYIDASEAWLARPLALTVSAAAAEGTANGDSNHANGTSEQQQPQQQQQQQQQSQQQLQLQHQQRLQKHLQARRGSQLAWNMVSDSDQIPSIPEFETIREPMYDYAGCNLLMDYARVSTPSRPG
ncbi:hypothetical protein BGZ73_007186 [Actinomortierella ambigua]|nr:hypothetical protein BGZ73_007186 [Actinomortierella ambigua]